MDRVPPQDENPSSVMARDDPLLQAARSGHEQDARRFLDEDRTRIEAKNWNGQTALHLAVLHRHKPLAKLLLDHGANVQALAADGRRPLFMAVERGDTEIAKLLLEYHALPDLVTDGYTALHLAVEGGDMEIAKLLLEYHALPDLVTYGYTALHLAVLNGQEEATPVQEDNAAIAESSLQHGTPVDSLSPQNPTTEQHQAHVRRHIAVARVLIDYGANIDATDPDGKTPLFHAVASGNIEMTNFLLQRGANKKIRLGDGSTVEDFAKGKEGVLQLLQGETLLQGPRVGSPKADREVRFTFARSLPPPSEDDLDKRTACQGFEVSMIDFFINDDEQRNEMSASVYDILYGEGPEGILKPFRDKWMNGRQPNFTWYHLPANNVRSSFEFLDLYTEC
jgi:ankyrin repeat protein